MTVITLTDAQKEELLDPNSGNALLAFIEINHPDLQSPVRVVNDYVDYVYGGNTYTNTRGGSRLVTDQGITPSATLTFPNVDRQIGEALRRTPDRAIVTLTILSSADFNTAVDPRTEIGSASPIYIMQDFEVFSASVSPISVEAVLQLRDYSQEPFPSQRATANRLPGLFL